MGKHRTVRRRGAVLAAAAAVVLAGGVGIASAAGVGHADPVTGLLGGSGVSSALLPVPVPVPGAGTTYVLPDLAPFTDAPPNADTRGAGAAEVTDEFGAPADGHKAALKLSTPASSDKVQVIKSEGGSPLASWVGKASYEAYQDAADNPIQFPAYQLIIDYNGAADGGFSTLSYEPVYNGVSTTPKVWHKYDVGTTGKLCSTKVIPGIVDASQTQCSNGGTHTLAEYLAAAPNATVTAVLVNQGSGNPGLVAAVDRLETPSTTYDFELTKPGGVVIPPIGGGGDGHGQGDGHGHGGHGQPGHGQPGHGHGEPGHGGHCGC